MCDAKVELFYSKIPTSKVIKRFVLLERARSKLQTWYQTYVSTDDFSSKKHPLFNDTLKIRFIRDFDVELNTFEMNYRIISRVEKLLLLVTSNKLEFHSRQSRVDKAADCKSLQENDWVIQ